MWKHLTRGSEILALFVTPFGVRLSGLGRAKQHNFSGLCGCEKLSEVFYLVERTYQSVRGQPAAHWHGLVGETMAKQVTITIETNSVAVLRARTSGRVWCRSCGTEGEALMLGPSNRADNAGRAVLQQLIAQNDVHHEQAPDGSPLICLNSLLAFVHDCVQFRGRSLRAIKAKLEDI